MNPKRNKPGKHTLNLGSGASVIRKNEAAAQKKRAKERSRVDLSRLVQQERNEKNKNYRTSGSPVPESDELLPRDPRVPEGYPAVWYEKDPELAVYIDSVMEVEKFVPYVKEES